MQRSAKDLELRNEVSYGTGSARRLRYDLLLHRGRGPESLSQGVTPQIGLLEPIFGPIAIESPSEAVENGLNYYSKLSLDSKSNCNYSNYGLEPPYYAEIRTISLN